jgi:vacuolar-type H+-ATPase catalytic subunit A/Vma1
MSFADLILILNKMRTALCRYCSPQRQIAMLKLILRFVTLAEAKLDDGIPPQRIADLDVTAEASTSSIRASRRCSSVSYRCFR